ncbi:hypothetical protein ACWIUH_10840 [Ursidibacter arcticus]
MANQFFLAKNPHAYSASILDILNSEIYIHKYGMDKYYQQIEQNKMIPDYVVFLPNERNITVLERKNINRDEFKYHISNILPSLEKTEFYQKYDRNKIYDRHQLRIFSFGISHMLETAEYSKGKIKLIRLEDDKAYIKMP